MVKDGSLKSLMLLWQSVLSEESTQCRVNALRDLKTVTDRVEDEGRSFLTITLPNFAKDFERSLELGKVDRNLFQGFSWKGGLPRFLSGFLGLVFDPVSGLLRDAPSADSIRAIRQLTLMYGKINLACSEERERRAIDGFISTERQLKELGDRLDQADYLAYHRVSRLLWSDVLTRVDLKVYDGELLPRHGPGSTADGLRGNAKFTQRVWTERLERYFPAIDYLFSAQDVYFENIDRVTWLSPGAELPVKVISVPKTQKTPRIIAIEPTCMQYAQQALREVLYEEIERGDAQSAFVGFTHQEPNQQMAQEGSLTRELATLDLSEASDRVSLSLVETMLSDHPHLHEAVMACRSTKAEVPNHGVVPLVKFASMGSALCFPIEAMVFTTVVFLGIQQALNRPLTRRDISSFRGRVRVYGDDIIVPAHYARAVVESLEHFGFRVNTSKSFWASAFRESCGKEYFDGHDVTVVRCRSFAPESRSDVSELVSWVDMRNQFYKAGLWSTARLLDQWLTKVIPLPTVGESSPALGRHSFLGYEIQRLDPYTHSPQVKAWKVSAVSPINEIDGYDALLKFFLKRGSDPTADVKHLERSGRPVRVDIKYGWVVSY